MCVPYPPDFNELKNKVMKAPEKIYLQVCGDCNANDCENCKFEDLEDNVTWCKNKIFDKDIEYTRTDAFIEKGCEYLMDYEFNDSPTIADRRKRVDEFKNYMKG